MTRKKVATKRICDRCHVDQTPLSKGLHEIANAKGICLGLFCDACAQAVNQAVEQVNRMHGAYIDESGAQHSSPRGTPADPEVYRLYWELK